MSSIPSPTVELAEGRANLAAEITPTEEDGARKERSMPQPSLEPGLNHLKPTTFTTSEEDASDKKSADQTAAKAATETLEKTSQGEKIEPGSDAVAGSGGVDATTANHTDVQMDSKLEEKADSERQHKVSRGEEFSDEGQDTENSGDESDGDARVVYTAEVQDNHRKRARKRIKKFDTYFRSVEYRMNYFEQELKKLRGDSTKARSKSSDAHKKGVASSEIVPSIRRVTWAEFKPSGPTKEAQEYSQRFTWDRLKVRPNLREEVESKSTEASGDQEYGTSGATDKHQHHVLEVLIEDPGFSKRRRVRKDNDGVATKASSQKAKIHQKSDTVISQTSRPTLQCPDRVRICSRPLLIILRRLLDPVNENSWNVPHMVFLRPFKIFVLYEAEIRVALKDLETRWQNKGESTEMSGRKDEEQKSEASNSRDAGIQNDDATTANVSLDSMVKTDSFEALKHLRLLVEFLDNDLRSTFNLRKQINAKQDCPIAFSDLWHLYEHGQEVRTPNPQIQVFKVAKFTGGRDLLHESLEFEGPVVPSSCIERQGSEGAFFVECYSYDFNGTQYGPVQTVFEIRRYEGLRDITSLQVYPLWFDSEYPKERNRLARRGEKFLALAGVNKTTHKKYRGISLDEHAEEVSWSNVSRYCHTKHA